MTPHLTLVPCNHYWLAVHYSHCLITAICNRPGCKRTGTFTPAEFEEMGAEGYAKHKPVRV